MEKKENYTRETAMLVRRSCDGGGCRGRKIGAGAADWFLLDGVGS